MPEITLDNKALIKNLPKGWKDEAAAKFCCSKSKIEKVAQGVIDDLDVLTYLVDMAEANIIKITQQKEQLANRVKSLVA